MDLKDLLIVRSIVTEQVLDNVNDGFNGFTGYGLSQSIFVDRESTDLAQAVGGTFPKEAVRAIIDGRQMFAAHGSREMPLWGEMFTFESTGGGVAEDGMPEMTQELVDERIDQLVAYIGTLQQ